MIKLLMALVKKLLQLLLLPLAVAEVPVKFSQVILQIVQKLSLGFSVLGCYFDMTYIGTLFAFCLSVMALVNGWRIIRWILRKIPFINID